MGVLRAGEPTYTRSCARPLGPRIGAGERGPRSTANRMVSLDPELDDYRSPLPWAGLVFVCIAVLARLSLST